MVYDRNARGDGSRDFDYGRGSGTGRDYQVSGRDGGGGRFDRDDYGARSYGSQSDGRFDQSGRYDRAQRDAGSQDFSRQDYNRDGGYAGQGQWRGSYASDGRHFEDVGRYRHADDDDRGGRAQGNRDYGRQPQGYEYNDRGFVARAGDEVRSWFGDEDAERRREADARYDDRFGGGRHDDDYRQWRSGQVSQLDRDYHEYRQENRAKFENEFSTWRSSRQTQRDSLKQVKEHAEVLGSDGQHVGTVDKVRDDRILLTKTDADAGGRHHSIPSRWIATVEEKTVTLSKTAADAKAAWEDEDRSSAMFGYGDNQRGDGDRGQGTSDTTNGGRDAQGRMLNRSFSGTY